MAVEYHFLQPVEDEADAYLRNLTLVSAITVAVGALLAWLVAGRVQRPVRAAGAAARAFGGGDLGVRLPVAGRDELAELNTSFNGMADQLQNTISRLTESKARQKQFVADVSHELRTPTASLLAAATALDNPDTRDSAAGLIAPQLRRLVTLTEGLLEISRMDAGEARLDLQPVDLRAWWPTWSLTARSPARCRPRTKAAPSSPSSSRRASRPWGDRQGMRPS